MKKFLMFLALAMLLISGCTPKNLPSVCDQVDGKSILCELSADQGVRLEDVGNALIVVNAFAIGEGVYTRKQAADVLRTIRGSLDSPVSYMFFRDVLETVTVSYPDLFEIADMYLGYFNTPQIMYKADQEILKGWLDKRITSMGGQK